MLKHLACIMDGNRRWAKQKGLLAWLGHKEGLVAAKRVINFCLKESIPYLSLYTFSLENFRRPEQELNYLFNVLMREMKNELLADCLAKGIAIRFVGDRALFPQSVREVCDELEEKTRDLKTLQVNLLFCYGGRQEIVHGIKQLMDDVHAGKVDLTTLTEEQFADRLWTGDLPAPDLIIRTGGVKRLSNFFLYQAAYSELYFLDCMWPELTDAHLTQAISSFTTCQRNFGA